MLMKDLGRTGLRVPLLGFGAMHVADAAMDEVEVARLLNEVLDQGMSLIDTARSYGESEARIGRHLAARRGEFLLSTKVGYGVEGEPDWTAACITGGVERALRLMRTEVLDIVHLHSCPLDVLRRDEVLHSLQRCREQGKLRVAAYSGDNEALAFAIDSGAFQAVQTSLSLFDQANLDQGLLLRASERGLGVLIKRPLASQVWRHASRPDDHAEGHYWDRWQRLCTGLELPADALPALALRFAAAQSGVSSLLVGSRRIEHLRANLAALAEGPLPAEQLQAIRDSWLRQCRGEPGMI